MISKYSIASLIITICVSTAQAGSAEGGPYPRSNNPLADSYLQTIGQAPVTIEVDSAMLAMRMHPGYRYPGRALMYSLVIPGGGQFYMGQWKRGLIYMVLESAAIVGYRNYSSAGQDQEDIYKDFANTHWAFYDWIIGADGFNLLGTEEIDFGAEGSHGLDFYIDADGDGRPEDSGNTADYTQAEMRDLIYANPGSIFVRKNGEYYENVGKYNQFHTGWDDSDSSWVVSAASGTQVHSINRGDYLWQREEANRLLSAASYTLSALMFNHVISGVDAIFSASKKNRSLIPKLSGSLLYEPANPGGIGGIRLSINF